MNCLSTNTVLEKGLQICRVSSYKKTREAKEREFKCHYGASPLDLSEMWYDLTTTDIPGAKLKGNEKSLRGFKRFMIAHYFLWTYPKNAKILASRFGICEKYARGEDLWRWIKKRLQP